MVKFLQTLMDKVNNYLINIIFFNLLESDWLKHIVHTTSFTKTVKLSIKICSKMILTGNYTCSQSINEKSHLCLAKYL